jgi:MGT family glycosyltransferase
VRNSISSAGDHAILSAEISLSHILVCSVPNPGHVGPMLNVAAHLKGIGHDVTFNTSEHFRSRVESADIRFAPLTGKANYDYRSVNSSKLDMSPADQKLHLMQTYFAEALADQHEVIQKIRRFTTVDLIVVDTAFFGIYPMLLGPKDERPPVICCGVNPMFLSSDDCGYCLPPADAPEGKQEIAEEREKIQTAFRAAHDQMDSIMQRYGVPPMPHFFIDCLYFLPDVFLQFTAEAFEFPRSDMPDTVRFAGPVLPPKSIEFKEPAWWKELDGSKPVVLVTQGTLANYDLNEVIQPALTGLADEDVLVIAAAGRSDMETLIVPKNARVASFVPFDRLLPKVDVMVTNGGYGAVNHAFSLGVPIVVAGETEEKDIIAARIGWTGAGINLKTRYAQPEQIRTAVRSILTNEQYRAEAERLRKSFARYNALHQLAQTAEEMLAQNGKTVVYAEPLAAR